MIPHMTIGPDRPSTSRTVVLALPTGHDAGQGRTQFEGGHALGPIGVLYGRHTDDPAELEAAAATALALAAAIREGAS